MPRPFSDLPRYFRAIRDSIEETAHEGVAHAAFTIGKAVIYDTPTVTGLHRSNWVGTIGAPSSVTLQPYVPYPDDGTPRKGERANANAAIQQIRSVTQGYRGGRPIYLTNNGPAIVRLNAGRSAQAPPSFVQRATKFAVRVTVRHMAATLYKEMKSRGF